MTVVQPERTNLQWPACMLVRYSLLLGGFIVSVSDLGETARWVVQTSYFWQGYEALMVNEFAGDPLGTLLPILCQVSTSRMSCACLDRDSTR